MEEEHSLIRSLSVVNGEVVVEHLYKTDQPNDPIYISVFDQNGNHLGTTPELSESKRKLVTVQGDRFFFLETHQNSEVGSYVVHEYRYEGIGK